LSLEVVEREEAAPRPRKLPTVDFHCHISITEYTDPAHPTVVEVSQEEFKRDLAEAGIDRAVVLSDARSPPEAVARFCSRDPRVFVGFGYVNPVQRGAEEEARRQRLELGLHGLKLYPCSDGYAADDPHAFKVYEVASQLGMPVMFHHAGMPTSYDLLRHTDPAQIDVVAHSFPELPIVLAHLGYPRVDETLYVARKHRNVYVDLSWPYGDLHHPSYLYLLWRDLLTALNLGVMNKVLFGTDYPGVRQKAYLEILWSVNRFSPSRDLDIPLDSLQATLDANPAPLLPPTPQGTA